MASILKFPRTARPTDPAAFSQSFAVALPAHRRKPVVLRHAAEREAQIAAAVARNQRGIANFLSLDHQNRVQKLAATDPATR